MENRTFRILMLTLLCICSCTCTLYAKHRRNAQPRSPSSQVMEQRKKILFITPKIIVGGIERAFINMIYAMRFSPQDIDICALERGGEFEKLLPRDIPIISLKQAKQKSYDIAVCFAQYIDPQIWVPYIKSKRKIQWNHDDYAMSKGTIDWNKEASIDQFVCVSKKCLEGMKEAFPKVAKRAQVIYNIINGQTIRLAANESILDMPRTGMLNVVTVARLCPYQKAIDRIVRVHKRLNEERIQFRWYVIGDGPDKAKLENLIQQSNLQGKFILLGSRMNPYPYIKRSDLFVLASLRESFGLVVSEAKLLGRPILVTDFCGALEQITSDVDGLIVKNNEDAIYRGMKNLLQNPKIRYLYSRNLQNFEYDNNPSMQALRKLFK